MRSSLIKLYQVLYVQCAAFLGATLLRILVSTLRWEIRVVSVVDDRLQLNNPAIFAFWHGRQLIMNWAYRKSVKNCEKRRAKVISSKHLDGLLMARIVQHLGLQSVYGSTRGGGSSALRAMLRSIQYGFDAALTPDGGGKGPIYKVKPGVIKLAQLSSAPIIPLTLSIDRCWILKSWDRMLIPKPFAKVLVLVDRPILVDRQADSMQLESKRLELENVLKDMTERADREMLGLLPNVQNG